MHKKTRKFVFHVTLWIRSLPHNCGNWQGSKQESIPVEHTWKIVNFVMVRHNSALHFLSTQEIGTYLRRSGRGRGARKQTIGGTIQAVWGTYSPKSFWHIHQKASQFQKVWILLPFYKSMIKQCPRIVFGPGCQMENSDWKLAKGVEN